MRVTTTVATLPTGPAITQYGQRAPVTLDGPADLGFPGNYGRSLWSDAATPRTDKPVRFSPHRIYLGLRLRRDWHEHESRRVARADYWAR